VNFSGGSPRIQVTLDVDYPFPYNDLGRTWSIQRLSGIQTLTAACHQTRAETAILRYTVNDFAIEEIDLAQGSKTFRRKSARACVS
jgi:hypothetical protein